MSVVGSMRRCILALAVVAVLVGGCDAGEWVGGSPDDARRIAEQFLAAVEAGDADTAWSLVYPPSQRARFGNDRASFEKILAGIDLSGVAWDVTTAGVHDGHYHVGIRLDPLVVDDELGVFLQVTGDHAQMQIDIEPLRGAAGVVGG
jgi:hypothetical protein